MLQLKSLKHKTTKGKWKMKYRELGFSGIKASVVGLGAWAIGGWMW
jgi:hypothetical protein